MATSVNTLPGVEFYVKDVPIPTVQSTNGDTVVIVGTALDGPINTPIVASSIKSLTALFGPIVYTPTYQANASGTADPTKLGQYSYNSLLKAYGEAVQGGAQNILLVRAGGGGINGAFGANYAVGSTGSAGVLLGGITVQSIFPGFHYNGSQISAVCNATTGTVITIVSQPASKGSNGVVFHYNANLTFDEVCAQFNADQRNQTFTLNCPYTYSTGCALTVTSALSTVTLQNGSYGTLAPGDDYARQIGKQHLYADIVNSDGTFDQIDGVVADTIVFADIYADDDVIGSPNYSFITDVTSFCFNQSSSNYAMNGILGIRPIGDTKRSTIVHRINRLTTVNSTGYDADDSSGLSNTNLVNIAQFISEGVPYTDQRQPGNPIVDLGQYCSVVVGPDIWIPSTAIGTYPANPAIHYAGVISQLASQQGATNTNVNANAVTPVSLVYQFTRSDRNNLNAGINYNPGVNVAGGAYVTYTAQSPGTSLLTVTSDVTVASRTSSFAQLQISRITQEFERVVRGVCQLFIGAANNINTITALDSQLQSALNIVASSGALIGARSSGYDYTIQTNTGSQSLGTIAISTWIIPAREILKIENYITVTS